MNWTEITVSVPGEYTESASAIANMTVPYGIYIEDYSDLETSAWEIAHIDLIDEDLINKDRKNSIIHIYIAETDNAVEALEFLKERLTAEKIPFEAGKFNYHGWFGYPHWYSVGIQLAFQPSSVDYRYRCPCCYRYW